MRIGMSLEYAGGFTETVEQLQAYEAAGLDTVAVREAYTFDAVSQLGFIAAKTSRVEIASGIFPIFTRTPTLLAMTAAGLDYVSDGRFRLGLGASGPQVIEGFHGVAYDSPLGRTREVVEICRKVWRRERVEHDGRFYHLPLTPEHGGSGLGKALKLINTPVRERIPVTIASIGPKNVELSAEIAEGWEPIFFLPEKSELAFGDALTAGKAKRDPALGELDVIITCPLSFEDSDDLMTLVRMNIALYVGGMGAKGKNFYNDLAVRYGFAEDAARIQDLYLSGDKAAAIAAVPEELARGTSLVGDEGAVKERLEAFRAAGVSTITVVPLAPTHERKVADLQRLKALC